ncbi:MAG: hypothetical protein D6732_17635 [Methanobacteriota archaeon]|nr:MAG: hypothetical protein D6732_17635 [Euryarchaeota archaeon]
MRGFFLSFLSCSFLLCPCISVYGSDFDEEKTIVVSDECISFDKEISKREHELLDFKRSVNHPSKKMKLLIQQRERQLSLLKKRIVPNGAVCCMNSKGELGFMKSRYHLLRKQETGTNDKLPVYAWEIKMERKK